MSVVLSDQLKEMVKPSLCATPETYLKIVGRIEQGGLTRKESQFDHCCVYFLPYNPETKQVFITHHKKSGLWLSPGGHIEEGETPIQTLVREIKEELGLVIPNNGNGLQPFMFSTTTILNPLQECKIHYDVWYFVETRGQQFVVDGEEFFATKWVSYEEACEVVKEPNTLEFLRRVYTLMTL